MLEGAKLIGAGAATIALRAAVGIGNVFSSLMNAVARNPSLAKQLFGYAILGFFVYFCFPTCFFRYVFIKSLRLVFPFASPFMVGVVLSFITSASSYYCYLNPEAGEEAQANPLLPPIENEIQVLPGVPVVPDHYTRQALHSLDNILAVLEPHINEIAEDSGAFLGNEEEHALYVRRTALTVVNDVEPLHQSNLQILSELGESLQRDPIAWIHSFLI